MKQQWEIISAKLSAMTIRERVFIFAAVVALILSIFNTLLLDPIFIQQKKTRSQLAEQQQLLSEVQVQIAAVQLENSPNSNSPQRRQINQLQQEISEGAIYLKSSRERLILPEKMAEHLRQLLNRNRNLQLVELQTMPVTTLLAEAGDNSTEPAKTSKKIATDTAQNKQVFKHGVQLTLRGNYLELMQYLSALEKLPQQMYWAKAQMNVTQYPVTELTLVLYTLSLDSTWLQI